jgi:hypothetical protein
MKNIRKVCDGKSIEESTIYLRKVGQFLDSLESVLDDNVDCSSTIWDTLPKELSKHLLTAQQLYVEYKLKTFHQIDTNNSFTTIETVISLIVNEQVKILQTTPSAITKPVFQRSDSSSDNTNKRTKWW